MPEHPSEVADLVRVLKSRSARLYIFILFLVLVALFAIGIVFNWPQSNDHFFLKCLTAAGTVLKDTYSDFFAGLFGMLISIFVARVLFGENPLEHSGVDAGIKRVTKSDRPLQLVLEFTERLGKLGASEAIISDNWLCALHEEMFPALQKAVISAVERGAKITFVIMHPNSPLVLRRELVVAKVRHHIATNIKSSLESLQKIYIECVKRDSFAKAGGALEVYCADSYLSLSAYVLPQVAYLGFFGAKDSSIMGPQQLVEIPSMMGDMVDDYAREAVSIGKKRQKTSSYRGEPLRYGVRVNVAKLEEDLDPENSDINPQNSKKLEDAAIELQAKGALAITQIFHQVLDSQAVDFFNTLSRDGAAAKLASFLKEHPGNYESRKSKEMLISELSELLKVLNTSG